MEIRRRDGAARKQITVQSASGSGTRSREIAQTSNFFISYFCNVPSHCRVDAQSCY